MSQVVLATNNAKKLTELRRVLDGSGIEVLGLSDVASYPEPAETEDTFEGNALIKARAAVEATGLPALADDSGIAVDALNGMPGVRSARWSGPEATDASNVDLLLAQLHDLPAEKRGARFVCAIAFCLPDGSSHLQVGEVKGTVATERCGDNGFGYDPLFVPVGETRTTAEMTSEEKDAISHRGQAVRAMVPVVIETLARTTPLSERAERDEERQ
ncbi:RdgB/HAM1 family non-canonical purine NTP pyrophosphatase [Mariniluteicoccus endophyticus]